MRLELPLARLLRWLALGLLCLALCPALAAATGPGRAFELVTPGDPVSASVTEMIRIDSDGTHMVYTSLGPMPGAAGGNLLASNEAVRGESGWSTDPIGFPYSVYELSFASALAALPQAFSPDFSSSIWVGEVPLLPNTSPNRDALYRLQSGVLTLLTNSEAFIGASEDTQHVVFYSEEHLLPADGARTEHSSIYEIDGTTLRLVDVDSGGAPVSACGSTAPSEGGVSRSGERIFFISPTPGSSCAAPSKVYLREGATTTVPVSASQCTRVDCNSSRSVSFAGATPDGSTVFMTTTQQLVNADVDEKRDLYAYEVSSGKLSLISRSAPGETGQAMEASVMPAESGSAVYFFAEGRLLPGLGLESGNNLYLANESGIHFVAPVGPGSAPQISKSGQVAVFGTAASLEAADTDEARDIYLYNAADESLTRVSAGPLGGNGNFEASITSPVEAFRFGLEPVVRALSEDGKQVFFRTREQLLPEDHNKVEDVYAWANGQLELISTGTGNADAQFVGSSADGSTVVFKTTQTILPADRDGGEGDLYAARLGGGFPSEPESAECTGESCIRPAPGRVVRGGLSSEEEGPERARGAPRVGRISPRTGREIVERGYTDIAVGVSGPGAVVARASERGGGKEEEGAALRGVAGAVRSGTVELRLRAAGWARRRLRRERVLRLRLSLSQADSRASDDIVFRLGGPR